MQNPADPQTLNRYSYCINNPLKYNDPTGKDYISDHSGGAPVLPEPLLTHSTLTGFLVRIADIILHPSEWGEETVINTIIAQSGVSVKIVPSLVDIQDIPVSQQQAYQLGQTIADAAVQTGIAVGVGYAAGVTGSCAQTVEDNVPNITQEGLDIVTKHLSQFDPAVENDVMVNRLGNALNNGQNLTGADLNFYNHEITEAGMMNQGVCYNVAHIGSIMINNVSPYSIYDPEAIQASIDAANGLNEWSDGWFDYWGISK